MAQQPLETRALRNATRKITQAVLGDADLGALSLLPGVWANLRDPKNPTAGPLNGRGWNMIALPAAIPEGQGVNFRLLMNQYNERLIITTKDTGVPNRGIQPNPPTGIPTVPTDQEIVALDYEQGIAHIATDDAPSSTLKQPIGAAIHHEPGLFLFFKNQVNDGIDIARLGTIPHGNSLLALGTSESAKAGKPIIPAFSGLPIGMGDPDTKTSPFLAPYRHFIEEPFLGLFSPSKTHELLVKAVESLGPVLRTTTLAFSTRNANGGIVNIPFIVNQANAIEMDVTFWILELEERGGDGRPRLIMMYHQVVMLEFFPRTDGKPGLIKWPHVSINTMERIPDALATAQLTTTDITPDALS